MTPPEVQANGDTAGRQRPPAVSVCLKPEKSGLVTLQKRSEFLACARARKAPAPAFLVQARRRDPARETGDCIRVGFTASKKTGNAVARNRAKRRLRALAREVLPAAGKPGWDYVLVARPGETVARDFALMRAELLAVIERLHAPRKQTS